VAATEGGVPRSVKLNGGRDTKQAAEIVPKCQTEPCVNLGKSQEGVEAITTKVPARPGTDVAALLTNRGAPLIAVGDDLQQVRPLLGDHWLWPPVAEEQQPGAFPALPTCMATCPGHVRRPAQRTAAAPSVRPPRSPSRQVLCPTVALSRFHRVYGRRGISYNGLIA
jgi:hypothetical protein